MCILYVCACERVSVRACVHTVARCGAKDWKLCILKAK